MIYDYFLIFYMVVCRYKTKNEENEIENVMLEWRKFQEKNHSNFGLKSKL